jgi:hypothetical protein
MKSMPRLTFGNSSICTYCGEPAEGMDHVIALSYQTFRLRRKHEMIEGYGPMTFACKDCNSHLSNRYFDTFWHRCKFASSRLNSKARPIIWSEGEISVLDPSLAAYIRRANCKHLLFRFRADWFEGRDYLLNIENLEWLDMPKKYAPYFEQSISGGSGQ